MAGYRKLGRTSSQRKAMLRSLVTALLFNGKIVTTEARAKEVKKIAEGLIALAVKEKDNFETVKVTAKVARKDKDGKRVKEVKDGKKVTVYDEVQKEIKKSRISYEKKKGLYGYGFIAIWIIGVIYMFIVPIFKSAWYSMCYTELVTTADQAAQRGMTSAGIYTEWNNFGNYEEALFKNQDYLPKLTESLGAMVPQVIVVMIFSLFIALLLNQKFRGRTFARAVFFLPVLVATGPVLAVIKGDISTNGISSGEQFSALFQTDLVDELLQFLGIYNLNQQLTMTIQTITSDIFNLLWSAGIQILIFLAALQQIPVSAKEAASMEGATGWEFFWKITFPMISPMILANLIYTVIDTFIDSENPVMSIVLAQSRGLRYGLSAAMAWIYFLIVAVALAIIVAIVSKFVFYEND